MSPCLFHLCGPKLNVEMGITTILELTVETKSQDFVFHKMRTHVKVTSSDYRKDSKNRKKRA